MWIFVFTDLEIRNSKYKGIYKGIFESIFNDFNKPSLKYICLLVNKIARFKQAGRNDVLFYFSVKFVMKFFN